MQDSVTHPATARDVDVCVCTFRRASVADLLASLAKLETPGWRVRVIVADNDDTPSARDVVEAAFATHGLDGRYIHAPARNISIARNACLNAATAPLIAFIDDDEIARPDWLAKLIAHHKATNASVVFGRVKATYGADAPKWMLDADLHSPPPPFRNGQIYGGYTCNVLLRRAAVGALRFDPAFGKSGGEDTTFFDQLQADDVSMVYAEDAVVNEPVPEGRASLPWLLTRAFRGGQSFGLVQLRRGKKKPLLALTSLAKITFCLAVAALTIWSPVRWRKAFVRSRLHTGALAVALGKAPVELYGEAGG